MSGYKLGNDEGSKIVRSMAGIRMGGNIYHPSWFDFIRYPDNEKGERGLVNSNAVVILADIVYWYRPIIERDEVTGFELPMRKRFKGRFLRKSRQEMATFFGMTLKQVSTALDSLEACGVIKRHIIKREKLVSGQTIYNVLEIELNHKRLEEITTPRESLQEVHDRTEFLQEFQPTLDGIPVGETYTENTSTKITKKKKTTAVNDAPPPSKPSATKAPSPHQLIIQTYVEELGYNPPNGGMMGKAAKWLVQNGYTPDQVRNCYRYVKAQKFYQDKMLSLQIVQRELPEFVKRNQPPSPQQPQQLSMVERGGEMIRRIG